MRVKCPECGKWNPASLPHCQFCGAPLSPDDGFYSASSPDWRSQLTDAPKAFVWVDEEGDPEASHDYRDALAGEMADLRKRKREGEKRQRELRAEAAARGYAPSGRTVRTTSNRGNLFSSMPDDPRPPCGPSTPIWWRATTRTRRPKATFSHTGGYRSGRQQVTRTRSLAPIRPASPVRRRWGKATRNSRYTTLYGHERIHTRVSAHRRF
jgi:hypothetical protein